MRAILWDEVNSGRNRVLLPAILLELVLCGVFAYLSYNSIGVPVSNAQGHVIRSTVTSLTDSLVLTVSVGVLIFSVCYYFKTKPKAIRMLIMIELAAFLVSLPALLYYNFYYSYVETVNNVNYTVYPMGVQVGIPFLFSLYALFITAMFYISIRKSRRISGFYIIRKENR